MQSKNRPQQPFKEGKKKKGTTMLKDYIIFYSERFGKSKKIPKENLKKGGLVLVFSFMF